MKKQFQFRFNDSKWSEALLSFDSLENLEVSIESVLGKRHPQIALREVHDMVLAHHKATKQCDAKLFGVGNFTCEVAAHSDDILQAKYAFTKVFGDEAETKLALKTRKKWNKLPQNKKNDITLMADKEPIEVSGSFTVMPGN